MLLGAPSVSKSWRYRGTMGGFGLGVFLGFGPSCSSFLGCRVNFWRKPPPASPHRKETTCWNLNMLISKFRNCHQEGPCVQVPAAGVWGCIFWCGNPIFYFFARWIYHPTWFFNPFQWSSYEHPVNRFGIVEQQWYIIYVYYIYVFCMFTTIIFLHIHTGFSNASLVHQRKSMGVFPWFPMGYLRIFQLGEIS